MMLVALLQDEVLSFFVTDVFEVGFAVFALNSQSLGAVGVGDDGGLETIVSFEGSGLFFDEFVEVLQIFDHAIALEVHWEMELFDWVVHLLDIWSCFVWFQCFSAMKSYL